MCRRLEIHFSDVLLLVNFFPKLIPEKYLVYLSKIAPVDLESFEAPADANFSENEFKAGILALSEHLALVTNSLLYIYFHRL